MTYVSRLILLGACCIGFALCLTRPAAAQESLPLIDDLVCPRVPPLLKPPPVRGPASGVSRTGTQMPSNAELGALVRTVIRDQPQFDPSSIAGLALGASQPRRIAFWGDSHIAGGAFAPTLIEALRKNGLSVASAYLPPTMGRANVRLPGLRSYCIGSGWSADIAYAASSTREIGPALADRSADAGPDSYLWLDLRNAARQPEVQQLQLVYRASEQAVVDYSVDDGTPVSIQLVSARDSQVLAIRPDRPISTLKLRVTQGKLVLHGFILDRVQAPTISFDVFGLPSATVRGWANADPAYLAQALHGVSYDGVVLEYGTNEGAVANFDAGRYAAMLIKALTNLRQVFPSASCVLVGPPDRGVLRKSKGRPISVLAYANIHQQIESMQRQIGKRFACAAWDWQDFMGGPGGSYGWAHAEPSLMGGDLTHLSPAGYRRTGHALARSLGWEP